MSNYVCWTPLETHTIFLNIKTACKKYSLTDDDFIQLEDNKMAVQICKEATDTLPIERQRILNSYWANKLTWGYKYWIESKNLSYWWPHCGSQCFKLVGRNIKYNIEEWDKVIKGKLAIKDITTQYQLYAKPYQKVPEPVVNKSKASSIADTVLLNKNVNMKDRNLIRSIVKEELDKMLLVLVNAALGKK